MSERIGMDDSPVGALIDAGNRQGGPFWFWKGVNPRAAAAAAMGAVIPLADFIAAAATGASGAAAGAVGVEALVAPGLALARGATLGAVVSSVGWYIPNSLDPWLERRLVSLFFFKGLHENRFQVRLLSNS